MALSYSANDEATPESPEPMNPSLALADWRDRIKFTAAAWQQDMPDLHQMHQAMRARQIFPHMRSHAHNGRVTLDVGADNGVTARRVRRVDEARRIYMFEPDPEKHQRLCHNFQWAHTYPYALTNFDSTVTFFKGAGLTGSGERVGVQARRLDSVMKHITSVTSLKISAHGHELSVLQGANLLIDRCRPVILFKSGPKSVCYPEQLHAWFRERGYRIYLPTQVNYAGVPAMTVSQFEACHAYPFLSLDFFAVPPGFHMAVSD